MSSESLKKIRKVIADAVTRAASYQHAMQFVKREAEEALRLFDEHVAALTQQEAEPDMIYHGRCIFDCGSDGHHDVELLKILAKGTKLYAHPPKPAPLPQSGATFPYGTQITGAGGGDGFSRQASFGGLVASVPQDVEEWLKELHDNGYATIATTGYCPERGAIKQLAVRLEDLKMLLPIFLAQRDAGFVRVPVEAIREAFDEGCRASGMKGSSDFRWDNSKAKAVLTASKEGV